MGRKKKEPVEKPHPYSVAAMRGRPATFKNPEQMQARVDEYFEWIKGEKVNEMRMVRDAVSGNEELQQVIYWKREPERPTITGLCLYLGFASRQAFDTYKCKEADFLSVITRAKMLVEKSYEERAMDRNSARGAIFIMGNLGWYNRTEVQQLGKDGQPVDPASPTTIITNVLPNTKKDI